MNSTSLLRVPPYWIRCFLVFSIVVVIAGSATGQDNPVAVVNGRTITQKEVEASVLAQTLPLEEKLYAIRKAALENLILRTLLEQEAEKRGVTVAELRKELASGEVSVTLGDVEAGYAENATFFAALSPDEARERLRLDLETQQRMQKYRVRLAKLKAAAQIDVFLKEPRLPNIGSDVMGPSTGPQDAAVTIVEYSDFQCPYCRHVQSAIKQLLRIHEKQVRLVFKHLPLQIHEQAFSAAQAAFCAGEQGKFWQYHDALFATDALTTESLNTIASTVGLHLAEFKQCLTSDSSVTAVRLNVREANELGINSTPTFIVNGKLIRGAPSFADLKGLVDRELKTAQTRSGPPQP